MHFNDRIYLLNNEQWAKYSTGIVTKAKAMLENANTIGFEEAMMLDNMLQTRDKA